MALYKFLRDRGVPEEEVLQMEREKIDADVAMKMSDDQLKTYISAHGHRLALRFEFNASKPQAEESTAERDTTSTKQYGSLIDRIRQRYLPSTASGNKKENRPYASRPGNGNAKKPWRKIKLTWKNWNGALFKPVRITEGGGNLEPKILKTATCSEILQTCENHFFKDGKSFYGYLYEFDRFLADGGGDLIDLNITLEEYFKTTVARPLRIYLHTTKTSPHRTSAENANITSSQKRKQTTEPVVITSASSTHDFEEVGRRPKRTRRNLAEVLGSPTSNTDSLSSNICSICSTTSRTDDGNCLRCRQNSELSVAAVIDRKKMDAKKFEVELEDCMRLLRERRLALACGTTPNEDAVIKLKILLPDITIEKTVSKRMLLKELLLFIGGQENSTPNFTVACNFPRLMVNYEMNSDQNITGTLEENGVTQSACFMVTWIAWTENILPEVDAPLAQTAASTNSSGDQNEDTNDDVISIHDSDGGDNNSLDSIINEDESYDNGYFNYFADAENVRWFTLRREAIVDDLMNCFKEDFDLSDTTIRCKFVNEDAIDSGGVFRDALTHFWREFTDNYCEGTNQCVPTLHFKITENFSVIGKIIFKGFQQLRYFPLRLAQCFVIAGVHGSAKVTEEVLQSCFLLLLSKTEADDLRVALTSETLSADLLSRIMEIFDRFSCCEQPAASNLKRITLACARTFFFRRCRDAIEDMGLDKLKIFPDFCDVDAITKTYSDLTPTTEKVLALLNTDSDLMQRENAVYNLLIRCVKNFNGHTLLQFIRFVTGADCVLDLNIRVTFDHTSTGLKTKFFAHVCSGELILPMGFENFNQFEAGLLHTLLGNQWDMLSH